MQPTRANTFKGLAPALVELLDRKKVTYQQFTSTVRAFERRLEAHQNFRKEAGADAVVNILRQRVSEFIEDLVLPGVIEMGTISAKDSMGKDVYRIIEENLNKLAKIISQKARSVLIQTIPGNGSELDPVHLVSYAKDLYTQTFLNSTKTYREVEMDSSLFQECKKLTFRQIDKHPLTTASKSFLKLLFIRMAESYPTSFQYSSIDEWKRAFDRHVERRIQGDANAGAWI
jgi:hypothetical protein